METKKIKSILLHVPQQIEGSPRGSVSTKGGTNMAPVTLELILPIGVQVTGKITNLLVPFSNIQGVFFEQE